MSKKLLIHIGLHKTGSSWLQQSVFLDRELGFNTINAAERREAVYDFVNPDVFDYDSKATRNRYRPQLDAAEAEGLFSVISHERLSGYPSGGGYDRRLIADRLHETFPEARILIVLREQRSVIEAMYSQHITDGGTGSVKRYLQTPEPGLGRRPYFRLGFYEYDKLIAYYQKLFGPERVLVLPFEMLRSNADGFLGEVQRFCGLPVQPAARSKVVNVRRPLLMQYVQRPLNYLVNRNELSDGALIHIPRFARRFGRLRAAFDMVSPATLERRLRSGLRKRISDHVGEHYEESNRRTEQLTGLDLAQFGYAVSQAPVAPARAPELVRTA
jgi:hypothetical protein